VTLYRSRLRRRKRAIVTAGWTRQAAGVCEDRCVDAAAAMKTSYALEGHWLTSVPENTGGAKLGCGEPAQAALFMNQVEQPPNIDEKRNKRLELDLDRARRAVQTRGSSGKVALISFLGV
jgi:hypothetical protein